MISEKYTLQEAFQKRLLKNKESVDIKLLYTPYKIILEPDKWRIFRCLSLESCFLDDKLKGEIYKKSDGTIVVTLEKVCNYKVVDSKELVELIASKLLSNIEYNIKVSSSYYNSQNREATFTIKVNPDINVKFQGEEEYPILELPSHTAYTF